MLCPMVSNHKVTNREEVCSSWCQLVRDFFVHFCTCLTTDIAPDKLERILNNEMAFEVCHSRSYSQNVEGNYAIILKIVYDFEVSLLPEKNHGAQR